MSFEGNDGDDEVAQIEQRIASADLATRADALTDMIRLLGEDPETTREQILPYILAAIDLNETLARDTELPGIYWSLSDAHFEAKDYEPALEALTKSIDYSYRSGNEASLPMTLSNMGNIANIQGRLSDAIQWYSQAYAKAIEQSRNAQAGRAALQLSRIYAEMHRSDEAVRAAQDAYAAFKLEGITPGMVDALHELAWSEFTTSLSFDAAAKDALNRSASLLELMSMPGSQDVQLLLSSMCATLDGKHTPEIMAQLDALLATSRERNAVAAASAVQFARALLLSKIGDHAEATRILNSLLTVEREIDTRINPSMIYRALNMSQIRAGDYFGAAQTCLAEVEYDRTHPDIESSGRFLIQQAGIMFFRADMPEQAIAQLELVISDEQYGESLIEDFTPALFLAKSYIKLGRNTEALILLNGLLERIGSGSPLNRADAPEGSEWESVPPKWMAELHESKLAALTAIGDQTHAEQEAQISIDLYQQIQDFGAVTRLNQTLHTLRREREEAQAQPVGWSGQGLDANHNERFSFEGM